MLPYVDNTEIFRNSFWYMQNSLNIPFRYWWKCGSKYY